VWYKNIAGRFFALVTKHACDRRTDRITTHKIALAQLRRAVKGVRSYSSAVAEMGDRLATIDMGRKLGEGCAFFGGELGPHLAQGGLGRRLHRYQGASS